MHRYFSNLTLINFPWEPRMLIYQYFYYDFFNIFRVFSFKRIENAENSGCEFTSAHIKHIIYQQKLYYDTVFLDKMYPIIMSVGLLRVHATTPILDGRLHLRILIFRCSPISFFLSKFASQFTTKI